MSAVVDAPPEGEAPHCNFCPACKQKIRKLNPHRMDAQKISMLEILARANGEWVFVQHGHGSFQGFERTNAPYRAEAHASRLAWFYLAEHGAKRSGLYRITESGILFLQGRLEVPAVIWCKDGEVVEWDDKMVTIDSIKDVILNKAYWDNYCFIQRDAH